VDRARRPAIGEPPPIETAAGGDADPLAALEPETVDLIRRVGIRYDSAHAPVPRPPADVINRLRSGYGVRVTYAQVHAVLAGRQTSGPTGGHAASVVGPGWVPDGPE
jgi:hypothetical protein